MKKIALILLASVFVFLSGCLFIPYYSGDNGNNTDVTVAPAPAPEADYGWIFVPDYGWVYWTDNCWVYYNNAWVYWPTFNVNVYHFYRYHPWDKEHQYYRDHPQKTYIPEHQWQQSHPGYQPHKWVPQPQQQWKKPKNH